MLIEFHILSEMTKYSNNCADVYAVACLARAKSTKGIFKAYFRFKDNFSVLKTRFYGLCMGESL